MEKYRLRYKTICGNQWLPARDRIDSNREGLEMGKYGNAIHLGMRIPDGKNKKKQKKINIKQKNKKTKTKLKNNKKKFFRNLTQMVKQTNKK